jgi:flagellar hook-associated protein 3 FlgL
MRISTSQQFHHYSTSIAETQGRYLDIQRQLASGKRISSISDDPAGTSMSVSLHALKSAAERYTKNLEYGQSFLKFTENSIGDTNDLMRRAYELAVRGANDATDQKAREGMIHEVNELQRRLIDLGNSRGPNGAYLFAGQMTNTKPFTFALGVPSYQGDQNPLVIEHAAGETLQVNSDADTLYLDAWNRLESLKANLQGGNAGAISGIDIPALQQTLEDLTYERGRIGAKLESVTTYLNDYERRIEEFSAAASQIEDVDMSEAIVEYRMAENAYQAALSVTSNGFQLSLLDYIR